MRAPAIPSAVALLIAAAVSITAASRATVRAADLPRYKFDVGQQLVYRTTDPPSERTDDDGKKRLARSTTTWTITVVARNDDGSFRQIVREAYEFVSDVNDEKTRSESIDGFQVDVMPDGEVLEQNAYALMSLPLELFPRLAPDAASLERGWTDTLPFDDTVRRYTSAAPGDAKNLVWSFEERTTDGVGMVHDLTNRRHFDFDLARGLLRNVSTTTVRGSYFGQATDLSTNGIELVEVRQLDGASLEKFSSESSKYFAAVARSAQEIDRADTDIVHAREHYDRGLSMLSELDGQFTVPTIRAIFDAKLRDLNTSRDNTLRSAADLVELLDKPSPQWTTTDLADNRVSLGDFRGQILLLDFWYRGCGWCLRAMPEIKKLVEDFKDEDVTVIGLNHDRTLDAAQMVIDRLKLNYRTLKDGQDDEAISKKYHVSGWPTLVILDRDGVVRHIHLGYVPAMRQQLGDAIRKLLVENQAAAQ